MKYGKGKVTFQMDSHYYLGSVIGNKQPGKSINEEAVRAALNEPIGSKTLSQIVKPGEKVVIVTSDITRPMPSYKVLPQIFEDLYDGGIATDDITIVLALGSHRPHTDSEKRALVGELIYDTGVNVIDSDMGRCKRLGFCKNGTPVDIFEPVVEADRIICIGNIEFHYFAGYSGGSKAVMPGTSSHEAIQANHSNMVKEGAFAGNLDTNPVRQDIDEITGFIKIDFIVNVVLDDKKNIVKAFAGDAFKAHREGCRYLDSMYKTTIEKRAEIVVVSAGGYPKDINIYQSQKGLDNSKHAVKDGGIIIWCAKASEGFGEKIFQEWMTTMTPKEMIEQIKVNFKLGGHKAAAIALMLEKYSIYMISDLDAELVGKMGFIPFPGVQEALDHALSVKGLDAKVLIMPEGGSVLPSFTETEVKKD